MDTIQKIFSLKFSSVIRAKTFLDRLFLTLTPESKGIKLYNPNIKDYIKVSDLNELDHKMNLIYQGSNLSSFFKNNLSYSWIKELKGNVSTFLTQDKSKRLLNLIYFSKTKEKLDLETLRVIIISEITKILVGCYRNCVIISENDHGVKFNTFYFNFSETISNIYTKPFITGDNRSKYVFKLLALYENFVNFKHTNYVVFRDIKCVELFREYHPKINIEDPAIIQHYNFKLIQSECKDKNILHKISFILELQSKNIVNDLLDSIATESLFDVETKYISPKKSESYIKLKNTKMHYIINDILPSVNSLSTKYTKSINNTMSGLIQVISPSYNEIIHKKHYLESSMTPEAEGILKKLKAKNPWCINIELLYEFLTYYQECEINLDSRCIKQLYDFDIENLNISESLKYDLIQWCYNLNNINFDFRFNIKDVYITKLTQRIKSLKIALNQTLIQACIMCCFDHYYYDWFYCTRGRIYIKNIGVSAQGSKIARFFVKPWLKNIKPKFNNIKYLEKTISSLGLDTKNLINLKSNNLLEFSHSDLWLKKPKEFFHLYSLIKDCGKFNNFNNTYALDATTSGIQMLGILDKDTILLEKCGAIISNNNFVGLYEKFGSYIKEIVKEYINDLGELINYNFINDFGFNPRSKYLKIQFKKISQNLHKFPQIPKISFDISKYYFLLSDKFLEVFSKKKFEPKILFGLLVHELRKFIFDLKNIPGLESCLYGRKFAKKPVMTIFYGSTTQGRVLQMTETYIDSCFSKGTKFNDVDFYKLKYFFGIINKIFDFWLRSELPRNSDLKNKFKDYISGCIETNKDISIKSKYFDFKYSKKQQFITRRNIIRGKKNTKISLAYNIEIPLNQLDKKRSFRYKKKILNSIVANTAHTMDKDIALDIISECLKRGIHVHTIHDCFRVDYNNANELLSIIVTAYTNLYKSNIGNQFGFKLGDLTSEEFEKRLNLEYFVKE